MMYLVLQLLYKIYYIFPPCSLANMFACSIISRLKDAWSLAAAVDSPDCWNELAEAALEHADLTIGKVLAFASILIVLRAIL